ncbi:DUF3027 domain-containing protein [Alloscardovia macacae]|nr:DUF3027 domain-containing protein [Alloscardovia macacae]
MTEMTQEGALENDARGEETAGEQPAVEPVTAEQTAADQAVVPVDDATVAVARAALEELADVADHVGDFVTAVLAAENVVDFRFSSQLKGYEGWQWSVTLYHDVEAERWTVNESSLLPTSEALLAPAWIPWKDRIRPEDISPTDVLGTDAEDERLERGVSSEVNSSSTESVESSDDESFRKTGDALEEQEIVDEFALARSRVLSPVGRAQTADRWYSGPHGPKSLSTRVAEGKTCQTCGFFVPIQGELGTMFGVCANKWSQDDGRVVSLDHGCGEHSDIEPPEPSTLWIQPAPTVDDNDEIILVPRPPREKPTAEQRRIAEILEDAEDVSEDTEEESSEE